MCACPGLIFLSSLHFFSSLSSLRNTQKSKQGVPSPSALHKEQNSTVGPSTWTPLLQTTPLLYEIFGESPEEAVFNFRRGISPSTTPVKLLISSDWRVGVAMFQPSTVWTVSVHLNRFCGDFFSSFSHY